MVKYFVCSDIHSNYYALMNALHFAGFERGNSNHILVICGDLFDRCNESVEVYQLIKEFIDEGRVIYIRGNHEDLMCELIGQLKRGISAGGFSHHHFNGTTKTLAHFMGLSTYDVENGWFSSKELEEVETVLMEFFSHTVDYFELGDYIFTHSWIPTTEDENGKKIVHTNWRDGGWYNARWGNPFEQWKEGLTPTGKTIVCGHWHTAWAHHHFRNDGAEGGNHGNYSVFKDDGIIGLDACTALTNKVNLIIFEEDDGKVTLVEDGVK